MTAGGGTPYVAVVGPGEFDEPACVAAEEVGRRVAERGAVLVCGGLGGVMEAACRGARAAGGLTVGFLPSLDRTDANPHVSVALPTGIGEMRNVLVVRSADVVIAIRGEFGTLTEIAFALKVGTPVVGIDTWRLSKTEPFPDPIVRAATPAEAVDAAFRLV